MNCFTNNEAFFYNVWSPSHLRLIDMSVYKRLRFTAYCTLHCESFFEILVFHTSLGFIQGKNQDFNTIADGL